MLYDALRNQKSLKDERGARKGEGFKWFILNKKAILNRKAI